MTLPRNGREARGAPEALRHAATFLEGLLDVERSPEVPYARLGVEPIRRLLARLGDPHRKLSVVHVGGSKGKGSVALLAEAVLRAAGERVGTFTSPHLESWTERFRIDGEPVAPEALAAAVERLRPHVEAQRSEDPAHAPTFFDATTAAALLLFQEAGVERAVLEVGLGGRLDSTNVVEAPAVCCIASIELEHTDRLGSTLAAIAGEKAGILKPGRPAVIGALPEEARAVIVERAQALGAPLAELGRDFQVEVERASLEGLALRFREGAFEVEAELPVLGRHQAINAALALACARRVSPLGDAALRERARRGLGEVRLPGRVELCARRPAIVVDSAHTTASARALAEALRMIPRHGTHLLLSISAGKDVGAILETLLEGATRITVTRAEPRRSLAPEAVAEAVRRTAPSVQLDVVPNPHLALESARGALGADDLLVVSGSIYLAGLVRARLARERQGS